MTLEVQILTCDRHKSYGFFCVCHKSGLEPLTSYAMVIFVSVTSQDLNL
jgi:hypothetical protein